jgi:predicted RecB family nuclease
VALLELHAELAVDARRDLSTTLAALREPGLEVIVAPTLPVDRAGHRHGAPSLLVAAHDGEDAHWQPVDVHNHLLTTDGSTTLLAGELGAPWLHSAQGRPNCRLRRGGSWRSDLLRLAHLHRMIEGLGIASKGRPFGGIVDRSGTLWWLSLDEALDDRGSALAQYDTRFAERVALLSQAEARVTDPAVPRPGAPWWHKECDACPFAGTCHAELTTIDDVSLVRFTTAHDQQLLRTQGIATRRSLAALDLDHVRAGIATRDEPSDPATPIGIAVGRLVADADRLVRRARVEVHGGPLLLVPATALDAHRADVEIDFDMESYDNATYVWGSLVTARVPTPGLAEGYRAFAEWGELSAVAEGELFARFFEWLATTVQVAERAGRTVRVYCFYEHAELTQMRRAMASGAKGLPTKGDLDALIGPRLVDVHRVVSAQLQTSGTAGLKVIAAHAGFSWRDASPSGEASMSWYETARGDDEAAARAAVQRLLEYNEDDCRATFALRDWLETGARELCDLEGARPPGP